MARALLLAERGRGRTSPNPMVGAVIVDRDGVVVGRGAHEYAGGPHAEIHALHDAGDRARGATLYCTLEPCCHTGRTGPCAPRVVEAGIARAVIASDDPNPLVSGGGIAHLRAHGIDVATGVMRAPAERLNRAFFMVMRQRRPFVTMKAAVSSDGRMAAAPGVRTQMTGAAANRLIHRERAEMDAIAVGSGTVLADDPLLTARGAYRFRPLTRVVFDSRLRTPPAARLFSTRRAGPVIIITTPAAVEATPDRAAALTAAGAWIEAIASAPGVPPLAGALRFLAEAGVSSVTVEGGAALHRSFWDAGLVDRVQIFVTPRPLGPDGLAWPFFQLVTGRGLADISKTAVGEDTLIEGHVHRLD